MRWVALVLLWNSVSAWAQPDESALARRRTRLISEGRRPAGTLPRARLLEAFRQRHRATVRCAEERLVRAPGPIPRVVVRFVVDVDGVVRSASFEEPPADERYGACLLDVVRSLQLPRPQGGPVTVTYPFLVCGVGY